MISLTAKIANNSKYNTPKVIYRGTDKLTDTYLVRIQGIALTPLGARITALVSMTPPPLLQFNKEVVTRDQGLRAQTLFVVFKPIGYERTDVPLVSIFGGLSRTCVTVQPELNKF